MSQQRILDTAVRIKLQGEISYPDPCWIVLNKKSGLELTTESGRIIIFPSEDVANKCQSDEPKGSNIVKKFTWDALVDKYSERFSHVAIDYTGKPGFYPSVPLSKET